MGLLLRGLAGARAGVAFVDAFVEVGFALVGVSMKSSALRSLMCFPKSAEGVRAFVIPASMEFLSAHLVLGEWHS